MYLHLMLKRMMDICGSLIGIIILSPVYLIVAILVHRNLGSPIIFRQKRPGKNGKVFEMLKFRSMLDKTDKNGEVLPDEKRLTSFGMKLRSTSLDELPELFNVLKGEMSLVGPRQIVADEIKKFGKDIKYYYSVKPGITGYWQTSGRSDVDYQTRVDMVTWYVKNRTLWMDIKILFKTITIVFSKKGAY